MLFVDTKTVCLIKEMKRSSFSDKGCARVCRGSRIFTFVIHEMKEKTFAFRKLGYTFFQLNRGK